MTPAQMAATLTEVSATTKASIKHTADLRRPERTFAIDESRCTDQNCTSRRCSCQRRAR